MLMPLTAGDWSLDETTLKALRADRSAKTHASAIATLDGKSAEALRTMEAQRRPLYLAAADAVISNTGTLAQTLAAAQEALDEIFDS